MKDQDKKLPDDNDRKCSNCTECMTNYLTGKNHMKKYCIHDEDNVYLTDPDNHVCGRWADDR